MKDNLPASHTTQWHPDSELPPPSKNLWAPLLRILPLFSHPAGGSYAIAKTAIFSEIEFRPLFCLSCHLGSAQTKPTFHCLVNHLLSHSIYKIAVLVWDTTACMLFGRRNRSNEGGGVGDANEWTSVSEAGRTCINISLNGCLLQK